MRIMAYALSRFLFVRFLGSCVTPDAFTGRRLGSCFKGFGGVAIRRLITSSRWRSMSESSGLSTMSYALREQQIDGAHRLFQPMLDLQTLTSALHIGFEIMLTDGHCMANWKPGDWQQEISTQFPDRAVRLSARKPMFLLAKGIETTALQISLIPARSLATSIQLPKVVATPFSSAMWRIAVVTYIAFYERWLPEIEASGGDLTKWPAIFAFAKRVRDFLAHNDGIVKFKGQFPAPVKWHNLTYEKSDEGRNIRDDLAPADILALMFEMDDEMTARGFPGS